MDIDENYTQQMDINVRSVLIITQVSRPASDPSALTDGIPTLSDLLLSTIRFVRIKISKR